MKSSSLFNRQLFVFTSIVSISSWVTKKIIMTSQCTTLNLCNNSCRSQILFTDIKLIFFPMLLRFIQLKVSDWTTSSIQPHLLTSKAQLPALTVLTVSAKLFWQLKTHWSTVYFWYLFVWVTALLSGEHGSSASGVLCVTWILRPIRKPKISI